MEEPPKPQEKINHMSRQVAKFLVNELERQFEELPELAPEKKEALIDILASTPIHDSEYFDEEPAEDQKYAGLQDLSTGDRSVYIYTTRIIRNWKARNISLRPYALFKGRVGDVFGGFNSEVFIDHLRNRADICEMIAQRAERDDSPIKLNHLSVLFKYEEVIPRYTKKAEPEKRPEQTAPVSEPQAKPKEKKSRLVETIYRERPVLIIPCLDEAELQELSKFEEEETKGRIIKEKGLNGILLPLRAPHYFRRHMRRKKEQDS